MKKITKFIVLGYMLAVVTSSTGCGKEDDIFLTVSKNSDQQAVETIVLDDKAEQTATLKDQAEQTVTLGDETEQTIVSDDKTEPTEEWLEPVYDYVHVCGAVKRPGVYKVKQGSHVFEVVYLAGGFLDTADETYLNQAEVVFDKEQLYVPTKKEVQQASQDPATTKKLSTKETVSTQENGASQGTVAIQENGAMQGEVATQEVSADTSDTKININTASIEMLCELPGIGETRAADIITYREQNGAFTSIEDIKKVSGIKDGLYSKIKNLITI